VRIEFLVSLTRAETFGLEVSFPPARVQVPEVVILFFFL
jgi:hypothetical protein